MIRKLLSILVSLVVRQPKEVDAVLTIFNTAVKRLDNVQVHHRTQVERQEKALQKAADAKAQSEAQIAQAAQVLGNIKTLLGK